MWRAACDDWADRLIPEPHHYRATDEPVMPADSVTVGTRTFRLFGLSLKAMEIAQRRRVFTAQDLNAELSIKDSHYLISGMIARGQVRRDHDEGVVTTTRGLQWVRFYAWVEG